MPTALTATHLRPFDLGLVALYLVGITLFGLRFRKKSSGAPADKSLRSYFLANNTIPWWAIMLSIVSAETSTLTIISIPGVAFAGDFGFLQVVIGYMLGRVVVAVLFLPRYFAGEMFTAYQLIDRRFGPSLHKVTAGLFLLTRAAAEGVRVFAVSIVVGIAIGTRDVLSIAIISALTLIYTFEGGMAAVIWTDVVQMFIYIGGTFVAIATLGSHVTGGWSTIHAVAAAAGKWHMFHFVLNLTTAYTFWAGVLGGTFLTMASHGTDQLMVQRMLAARNLRQSQLALLSSGVVIFIQFALFLLIGVGLYVFYGQHPATFASADRIFPTFIVREMPLGIAGLLVAAILAAAMSNLSAALNSLSSATVVDFYMHFRPSADDRERALISKSSTVLWALVLFAIAVYSVRVGGKGHVVEVGLSIASVAYGCLLGVFLLGTLTKFATQTGATIGMVCGFALNLWLWQGAFPVHLGPLTIPHIAWTWYVLIGAAATFGIGALCSLVFRKQSRRIAATATALLLCSVILSGASRPCDAQSKDPESSHHATTASHLSAAEAPSFASVSTLINTAIAERKLPGAVVLIGHDGRIVFEHAYGLRKLAGEPGLNGLPSPAEPMTEDTLFDMASLTKDLATAPAIMQLYESGKIASLDDPLENYLPAFNPAVDGKRDPIRSRVTLRLLLTHTSGEPPDVDLKSPWGLAHPDKAEGIALALTTPLESAPGRVFRYSDINFILLGDLIETLSGEPEDVYVQQHIFTPLGMTHTTFHSFEKACGTFEVRGAAIFINPNKPIATDQLCASNDWSTSTILSTAPTAHDDEGTPATNPDYDHLLRGTVDDPTSRRMGGVAGHAGVFSTAHDVALYAQALLDKLLRNTGPFPLSQSTLRLMTTPAQPSTVEPGTILTLNPKPDPSKSTPTLKAIQGTPVRGFGWDINSAFSRPRGAIFPTAAPSQPSSPTPSFGHTGYTGTSLWIDPGSDTYVILLANAIHPRGRPPISHLRGDVATAAALALHLYSTPPERRAAERPASLSPSPEYASASGAPSSPTVSSSAKVGSSTLTGIDVLESTHFAALRHLHRIGLLTNQTGLDSRGRRTIDILHALTADNIHLTTLFTPEHGLYGAQDTTHESAETDPATHLPVVSLYGPTAADKHPTHAELKDLDAVVIDLQDVGVRFFTYETVLGYFLEAAAAERTVYHHPLEIIVLDRPNPLGGEQIQGPVSDPGSADPAKEVYTNFMPLPLRHGLTLGELARYFNGEAPSISPAVPDARLTQRFHAEHTPPGYIDSSGVLHQMPAPAQPPPLPPTKGLGALLTVVPMQHWTRAEYFDQTGLPWINPSPNLHSLTATTIYPGPGLLDYTNISVGRGTSAPFENFGAGAPPTTAHPGNSSATNPGAPSSRTVSSSAKVGPHDASGSSPSGPWALDPGPSPLWFNASTVAAALNARHIPGVSFSTTTMTIAENKDHYPYHGQTIPAVHITLTDRNALDSPELGLEILSTLHHLYPTQFHLAPAASLLANKSSFAALLRGDDSRAIAASWNASLDAFRAARQPYLLYR